jgi:hypothetical protein
MLLNYFGFVSPFQGLGQAGFVAFYNTIIPSGLRMANMVLWITFSDFTVKKSQRDGIIVENTLKIVCAKTLKG